MQIAARAVAIGYAINCRLLPALAAAATDWLASRGTAAIAAAVLVAVQPAEQTAMLAASGLAARIAAAARFAATGWLSGTSASRFSGTGHFATTSRFAASWGAASLFAAVVQPTEQSAVLAATARIAAARRTIAGWLTNRSTTGRFATAVTVMERLGFASVGHQVGASQEGSDYKSMTFHWEDS